MGHIEWGIGLEQQQQQQEEKEEWGSPGRTTRPSRQHHTDQSVRTSRSQLIHKNNIHAHTQGPIGSGLFCSVKVVHVVEDSIYIHVLP